MPASVNNEPIRVSVPRRNRRAVESARRDSNAAVSSTGRPIEMVALSLGASRPTRSPSGPSAPVPQAPVRQSPPTGIRGRLDAAEGEANFIAYASVVRGDAELRSQSLGPAQVAARLGHPRALEHFATRGTQLVDHDLFEDVILSKSLACVDVLKRARQRPQTAALERVIASDDSALTQAFLSLAPTNTLPLTLRDHVKSAQAANLLLNSEHREGNEHLATFAPLDDQQVIERLLRRGCRVTDDAVLKAIHANKPKMVRYLLAHGGSAEATGIVRHHATTALQLACRLASVDIVRMLVNAGGDPHVVNAFGDSAADIAAARGDSEILSLVQKSWGQTLREGVTTTRRLVTNPINIGGTGGAAIVLGSLKLAGAFTATAVAANGLPFVIAGSAIVAGIGYLGGAGAANAAREQGNNA